MSTDLLRLLDKARAAIRPHDPARAAGGRCNCLSCRTARLAARGWPTSTIGDGSGVRSTSTSSTTERAAAIAEPFTAVHGKLDVHLARRHTEVLAVLAIAAVIDSHASDDDVVPAGTGECACGCGRTCNPRKNPDNRLKAGLHPSCHRRWLRWRSAYPGVTWSDFIDACYLERGETRARPVAGPRAS
jgi:hypothetical protein